MSEGKDEWMKQSNRSDDNNFMNDQNNVYFYNVNTNDQANYYSKMKTINHENLGYLNRMGRNELIQEIIKENKNYFKKYNYLDSNLEFEVNRIEIYQPPILGKNQQPLCCFINSKIETKRNNQNNSHETKRIKGNTYSLFKEKTIIFIIKIENLLLKKRLLIYFNILKQKPEKNEFKKGDCKNMLRKIKKIQTTKSMKGNQNQNCFLINNTKRYLKHYYYSKSYKNDKLIQGITLIQFLWRKHKTSIHKYKFRQMRFKYPLLNQNKNYKPELKENKTILSQYNSQLIINDKRIQPCIFTKIHLYSCISILNDSNSQIIEQFLLKSPQKQLENNNIHDLGQNKSVRKNNIQLELSIKKVRNFFSLITKDRKVKYMNFFSLLKYDKQYKEQFITQSKLLSRTILKLKWNNMIYKIYYHVNCQKLLKPKNQILLNQTEKYIYSIYKILSKNIQEKVFYFIFVHCRSLTSHSFYFNTIRAHLYLIKDFNNNSILNNDIETKYPVRIALSQYFNHIDSLNLYSLYYNDKKTEMQNEANLIKDIFDFKDIEKLIVYMHCYISKFYSNTYSTIVMIKNYLMQFKTLNTSIFGISRLIKVFLVYIGNEHYINEFSFINKPKSKNCLINIMLNQIRPYGTNTILSHYQAKSICNEYSINIVQKQINFDTKTQNFLQLYIEGYSKMCSNTLRKDMYYYSNINQINQKK